MPVYGVWETTELTTFYSKLFENRESKKNDGSNQFVMSFMKPPRTIAKLMVEDFYGFLAD